MRTHRYNAPSNPDRRSTRKGVGAPDRFALLAKMAEADRDRNGSRTDWKRYAFLLADGRHKHPLAGAAIRARTPSELDGHSVDCQSGPRVGVEARIRRSNSADRQRVYGRGLRIHSPQKLTEADTQWLLALKRAAEQRP